MLTSCVVLETVNWTSTNNLMHINVGSESKMIMNPPEGINKVYLHVLYNKKKRLILSNFKISIKL